MKATIPAPNRPVEFDARVMSYQPHLRRLANKLSNNRSEADDLVQDTLLYLFGHWASFRPDGGFYKWITLCMRHVAQNGRRSAARRAKHMRPVDYDMQDLSVPPNQLDHLHLVDALNMLGSHRHGAVLIKRAMGDGLKEIGAETSTGVEWVRQREVRARRDLLAAMRVAA